MERISLNQRKDALLKKLETLKSQLNDESSPTRFSFIGRCGKQHAIETKLDKNHGISYGQLLEEKCDSEEEESLYVCVGTGAGCTGEDGEFLWFLKEEEKGITYWPVSTLEELKKRIEGVTLVNQ